MALTNGIVLAVGSLLVAVPIILHLLMQPKPKILTFPALRFVRQRQQSNRRQMQMRHWILLLLRCLVIVALVLALAGISSTSASFSSWSMVGGATFIGLLGLFLLLATLLWTRPVKKSLAIAFGLLTLASLFTAGGLTFSTLNQSGQQVLGNRVAPVSAVIIVDTSPRMEFVYENQSRLDYAREMTKWLVEQLPEDSQVSIALPDGSEPFFSVDISAAEKRIETLAVDYESDPLATTIGPALRLLEEADNERRELYVVTDLTRRSWREAGTVQRQLEDNPDVSLYLLDIGVENPENITIGQINFNSQIHSPSSQLEIETTISSLDAIGRGIATLYLEKPDPTRPIRADGETLLPDEYITREQIVDTGNKNAPVKFILDTQLQAGVHHGWIEFESGDGLKLDDRRYFTVQIRPAWQVLVVSPRGVNPDNLIENLSPYSFRETGKQQYDCHAVTQSELTRFTPRDLAGYQAVFLLNPTPLSDGAWNLLATYGEDGGSIAMFLGNNAAVDGQLDESFSTSAARRVMPGRLSQIYSAPRSENEDLVSDGSIFLVSNSMTHPVNATFNRAASRIRWDLLPVHLHWGMRSFEDQQWNSEVLFRFTNQVPALVERDLGNGRCMVMMTAITEPNHERRWNDLFYDLEFCWPAFQLVRNIADYLVSVDSADLNLALGEPAVLPNDRQSFPPQYRLFTPKDEEPIRVEADGGQMRYRFTNFPGQYRLKGNQEGVVLRGFSVNLVPADTNLARVDATELDEWLGEDRYRIATNQEEIEREQGASRVGREFYPLLVTLLAVFLGLELLLSNRFYQQRAAG